MLVHLSSKDVIHSFGAVRDAREAGRRSRAGHSGLVHPNRIGDYEIACSQLCGLGHFRMRGFMSVKSDADYQGWLAEEAKALAQ